MVTMPSSLTVKGYGIPLVDFEPKDLEKLKEILTVKPVSSMSEDLPSFKVYNIEHDTIYVPKAFGLKHYGIPEKITISDGLPVDIAFRGTLRPVQEEAANAFVEAARDPTRMGGIVNLPCAGGKTVIGLNIITRLKVKALIVCHKEFLIDQWKERILEFVPGARVGIIKAKVCDYKDKDIVIGSLQSLTMKWYDPRIFAEFGILVLDEIHRTAAEVFSRIYRTFMPRYALGLSATLDRKDGLTRVFKWNIGDIVYKGSKAMRDSDVKVVVKNYYNSAPAYSRCHKLFNGKPNVSRMINNLCNFTPRTTFVVDTLLEVLQKEPQRRVLLLSDRRGHLEVLKANLESHNISAGLYYGGLSRDVLEDTETKQVMLGTYSYVSEGFDNKNLNTMVLASPKSDVIQVVGRILRTPANERKVKPLVIDIVDDFSLFPNQARKRVAYYKNQGFSVSDDKMEQVAVLTESFKDKFCIVEQET
jgi:superfamily II DNA or RNA helicase